MVPHPKKWEKIREAGVNRKSGMDTPKWYIPRDAPPLSIRAVRPWFCAMRLKKTYLSWGRAYRQHQRDQIRGKPKPEVVGSVFVSKKAIKYCGGRNNLISSQ